jgi:hypothetical protein
MPIRVLITWNPYPRILRSVRQAAINVTTEANDSHCNDTKYNNDDDGSGDYNHDDDNDESPAASTCNPKRWICRRIVDCGLHDLQLKGAEACF